MLHTLKIALPILSLAVAGILPLQQSIAAPIDTHRIRIIAPDDGGAPRLLPSFPKDARP